MRSSRGKAIEILAVVGVYIIFIAIGLYSGQTTIDVDIVNPSEELLHSSPVELVARATVRGVPMPDVRARFTIQAWASGESNIDTSTDADGVARVLLPASPGNYTWHVTVTKEGYPTIISRSVSFSVKLLLVVDAVSPSPRILAVSPVSFTATVADMNARPVESANVIFYVDSTIVGSSATTVNGIARLSSPVASGRHTWFASASKNGEGGISETVQFLVGQASLVAGSDCSKSEIHKIVGNDADTSLCELLRSTGTTGTSRLRWHVCKAFLVK